MNLTQLAFLRIRVSALLIALSAGLVFIGVQPIRAQSFGSQDRDRGVTMLRIVKEDIRKNYYDPSFHGIDLDARFKAAEEKMKLTKSNAEVFGIIAQTLIEFNDSHTAFLPPSRSAKVEYGWLMKMFADNCYVTQVRPHSDADAKGLKPGDLVLSIDGIQPTRANTWVFYYLYYQLAPRPSINVVVKSPGEQPRPLELKAKVETGSLVVDVTEATGMVLHRLEREEEDEEILDWMMEGLQATSCKLQVDANWNIVETSGRNGGHGYRFYPDKLKGEGFFIAAVRKSDGSTFTYPRNKKQGLDKLSRKDVEELRPWIAEKEPLFFFRHDEFVRALPASLAEDLQFLQSFCYLKKAGVLLGQPTMKEFIPEHELALSILAGRQIPAMELSRDEAIEYLRKEEVQVRKEEIRGSGDDLQAASERRRGWSLVRYKGQNLGWVKVLPNRINNYYPKEWRILKRSP